MKSILNTLPTLLLFILPAFHVHAQIQLELNVNPILGGKITINSQGNTKSIKLFTDQTANY